MARMLSNWALCVWDVGSAPDAMVKLGSNVPGSHKGWVFWALVKEIQEQ